jgi:hypothetical protein
MGCCVRAFSLHNEPRSIIYARRVAARWSLGDRLSRIVILPGVRQASALAGQQRSYAAVTDETDLCLLLQPLRGG